MGSFGASFRTWAVEKDIGPLFSVIKKLAMLTLLRCVTIMPGGICRLLRDIEAPCGLCRCYRLGGVSHWD